MPPTCSTALCQANEQLCLMKDGVTYPFASYDGIQLLGRALSALLDLFTLIFMFFIGKRLYGVKVGVLAAALGAATVLQIQQSHFYTADMFATFFVVAAMFFIIRLGDTFSWPDTIAAGAASGLAVASRINVAPIVGILAVALVCARLQPLARSAAQSHHRKRHRAPGRGGHRRADRLPHLHALRFRRAAALRRALDEPT